MVEPCTGAGADLDEDGFSLSDTMLLTLLESPQGGDSPAEKRTKAALFAGWLRVGRVSAERGQRSAGSGRKIEADPGVEAASADPAAHEAHHRQTTARMAVAEAAPSSE